MVRSKCSLKQGVPAKGIHCFSSLFALEQETADVGVVLLFSCGPLAAGAAWWLGCSHTPSAPKIKAEELNRLKEPEDPREELREGSTRVT